MRAPVEPTEIKRILSITTPQNIGTHSVFQKLPQEIESSFYSQYFQLPRRMQTHFDTVHHIDTCSLRHSIRVSTLARSMEVL